MAKIIETMNAVDEPEKVETMNAAEAAEWLRKRGFRMSPDKLRKGIMQGVYKFGECVMINNKPETAVYVPMLEEYYERRLRKNKVDIERLAQLAELLLYSLQELRAFDIIDSLKKEA